MRLPSHADDDIVAIALTLTLADIMNTCDVLLTHIYTMMQGISVCVCLCLCVCASFIVGF